MIQDLSPHTEKKKIPATRTRDVIESDRMLLKKNKEGKLRRRGGLFITLVVTWGKGGGGK